MKPKITHITTVHSSQDSRIFQKECRSMVKLGFDVCQVAPHPKRENIDGVEIFPLKKYSSRLKRMLFGPFNAFSQALKTKSKVCHFHDPELMPMGILLALCGKKVVYDTHEVFPAQIMSKTWINPFWMRSLVAKLSGAFEKFAALFYARVVAAIPEGAEPFGKKGVVIRNVPVLSLVEKAPSVEKLEKKLPAVIFSGGIFEMKGIYHLVDAFKHLEGKAELWLLGRWESEEFKKRCEKLEGYKSTKYIGMVHPDEVFGYMKQADIGACTFLPVPNYLECFPIKSFEYMACGLPALMSDFPYYRKHFVNGCSFVDPENPDKIAEAIIELIENPEASKQKAIEGKSMVMTGFNWDQEELKLANMYKEILKIN